MSWYFMCKHHFRQEYKKDIDLYADADAGETCDYPKCKKPASVEYYPGLCPEISRALDEIENTTNKSPWQGWDE